MYKSPFLLVFILLMFFVESLSAQNRVKMIEGKVFEHIMRSDGKSLDIPIAGARVYIQDQADNIARTDATGKFSLKLDKNLRKDQPFSIVIQKPDFGMIREKGSVQVLSSLEFPNWSSLNPNQLSFYLSKLPRSNTTPSLNNQRTELSGYITYQNEILEGVEVLVKGVEEVHDNTNEQGYFEIFLPSSEFQSKQGFSLIIEKGGKKQEFTFKNIQDFKEQQFFEFSEYTPPKNLPRVGFEDTQDTKVQTDETPIEESTEKKSDKRYIEKNFRKFIDNLDRIDFKNLSPQQINALKDSLNRYADYITEITEDNTNLKQGTDYTNYLRAAKELAEKEKKLLETEKELVQSELQNQNKTIVIVSLSIILLILAGWVYYYFYVNRKISLQAGELNKRNHFIEFLLKELNHRVTNNLQVISSMLRRKMRRMPDENAKNALKEINRRVIDISAIHVGLYSKNEDRLTSLKHYIRNITNTLDKLYTFEKNPVHIEIELDEIQIEHKNAVFFGLIINELVTNSMKYAYESVNQPKLWIQVHKKSPHFFELVVKDNGPGVPPDFKLKEAKSSGLKLVHLISEMLDGSFEMNNKEGAEFKIRLKLA